MNLRPLTGEQRRSIRVLLKAAYDAVLAEPVPQSFHDAVRKLK